MSWRETVTAQSDGGKMLRGSLGGASFVVPQAELECGRRTQTHEYPLQDIPWVEDLGRSRRLWRLEVFVDARYDQDYTTARDALIAVIEKPGPHTLIHPWYGQQRVSLAEPARVRESSREGGRATFNLVLSESGERNYPSSGTDTPTVVQQRADTALQEALSAFSEVFSTDFVPEFVRDGAGEVIASALDEISSAAALVPGLAGGLETLSGIRAIITGGLASLLASPSDLADQLTGAVAALGDIADDPGDALRMQQRLWSFGDELLAVPRTTATRVIQSDNQSALAALVRRTAVIEAARSAASIDYEYLQQAVAARDSIADALDAEMEWTDAAGNPVDDALYSTLQALRSAVVKDVTVRGANLATLVGYTPLTTLPALVVAHDIYGDATRADDISARNQVRHPGFVPGGTELEVLSV